MSEYYVWNKDTDEVRPVSLMEWTRTFEEGDRRVALDTIKGYDISTVFLGISHGQGVEGPLLFETMIFKRGSTDECHGERYSTSAVARERHAEICKQVEAGELPSAQGGTRQNTCVTARRR